MSGVLRVIVLSAVLFETAAPGQTRQRSEIPAKHIWKLQDLYVSEKAWDDAKNKLVAVVVWTVLCH